MSISADRQALIDKVTKLLALADSSTHSEESNSARDMAAKLMAKHNIEVSEAAPCNDYSDVDGGEDNPARTKLLHAIAKFSGIMMYRSSGTLRLVGSRADLEAYEYTAMIITRQRERACFTYLRNAGATKTNTKEFYLGFALGVAKKLKDLKAAADNQVQEWGLVVIDPTELALRWYTENVGRLSKGRAGTMGKFAAAGYDVGKNVSLHKGVGEQSSNTRLAIGR
jgi:hypothetical protein